MLIKKHINGSCNFIVQLLCLMKTMYLEIFIDNVHKFYVYTYISLLLAIAFQLLLFHIPTYVVSPAPIVCITTTANDNYITNHSDYTRYILTYLAVFYR